MDCASKGRTPWGRAEKTLETWSKKGINLMEVNGDTAIDRLKYWWGQVPHRIQVAIGVKVS